MKERKEMLYEKGNLMSAPFTPEISLTDFDYMKSIYPLEVKGIQQQIDNICDRMECDGSTMFDQYPDRVRLEKMTDYIYGQIAGREEEPWLRPLVGVMLYNEMIGRRCRRREHKKGMCGSSPRQKVY